MRLRRRPAVTLFPINRLDRNTPGNERGGRKVTNSGLNRGCRRAGAHFIYISGTVKRFIT